MKAHDLTHWTDSYWTFNKWYEYARQHYMSPARDVPPEWITWYYDPTLPFNFKSFLARPWLLTCWFLTPHDRRTAELLYQGARTRFLVLPEEGRAYFSNFSGSLQEDTYATAVGLSLAREFGDAPLYGRLRAQADTAYGPTFDAERGEFYYRFGFEEAFPRGQYNDWIMPAMVGDAGTWWQMFNEPNLKKFVQPTLHGVDYGRLGVSQAFYDAGERLLVLATYPADRGRVGEETAFRVRNLMDGGRYTVEVDGKAPGRWRIADGEMEIVTTVDHHAVLIRGH